MPQIFELPARDLFDWRLSLIILISFLLTYAAGRAIYIVYLHPLARYPGPKVAAATQLPYVHALTQGRLSNWVKDLHDKYSSNVVRISPTELSFINASAWTDINGHRVGQQDFEKDLTVYGAPPNGIHSLLTASRVDHSRMRRVLDHAFSTKAFKEQEPIVLTYIDSLINRLRDEITGPTNGKVNLVLWYSLMSFDITGDLAFGDNFRCLENQRYHSWVALISANLKAICVINAFNRFPPFRYLLPLLITKSTKKIIDDHWMYTTEKITRRLELGDKRADFMSHILKNNIDGKGLSQDEIQSNASLFIIAGSDSVATALSGATYFLLRKPDVKEKLTEEIDSAFQSEEDITAQNVERLPYLNAVLSETHRIYPTALTGQACRVPAGGASIAGSWVPGGTGVSINQFAAFRSARNFNEPDAFIPERWLDDPRFASDNKDVFHPFSVGPRNCIGKTLGQAETRVVLAKMLWNFTLELCEEETGPDWTDQESYLSWHKKPLIVQLAPRKI